MSRYKRFFADVEYNGEKITIHVPNTGSLKGVIEKNIKQKCLFSLHGDNQKKLKGTLEAVQTSEGAWVGVNTSNPNRIVREAIENSLKQKKSFFNHWQDYRHYQWEYKISKETRLDGVFCREKSDFNDEKSLKHFVEIKNTTLASKVNGKIIAMFPDAITERGQKHLKELMKLMDQGHKAELLFTIQREDAVAFTIAKDIDPEYFLLFRKAIEQGLVVTPALVIINENEVKLTNQLLPLQME